MPLVVPNASETVLLDWLFKETGEAVKYRLYKNNVTPSATTVLADLTEADFTGYTAGGVTVAREDWTAATSSSGKALVVADPIEWTAASDQTIYGYYVVSATSGDLLFVERFAETKVLTAADDLEVTPRVTLASEA